MQIETAQLHTVDNQINEIVQANSAQLETNENKEDEIVQTDSGQFPMEQRMPKILLNIW